MKIEIDLRHCNSPCEAEEWREALQEIYEVNEPKIPKPTETTIAEKYAKLLPQYEDLQGEYNALDSDYDSLESKNDALEKNAKNLRSRLAKIRKLADPDHKD